MNKYKKYVVGILVGLIAFPTLTLGGGFVSSLIQGKSVEEAVQILADQMDILIGRVDTLEENQASQLEKIEACSQEQKLLYEAEKVLFKPPYQPDVGSGPPSNFEEIVSYAEITLNHYNNNPSSEYFQLAQQQLGEIRILYEEYKKQKAICES